MSHLLFRSVVPRIVSQRAPLSTAAAKIVHSQPNNTELSEYAREIIRVADAVCFDVDSTVITTEAVDELARLLGKEQIISSLTEKAMNGSMLFEDTLQQRLELLRPSRADIGLLLAEHPAQFTPGVQQVIARLQERGTHVYLLSGGFRQLVNPIAEKLGVPTSRVFANNLEFTIRGDYVGFDHNELTSRDGGKGHVFERLTKEYGYKNMIMVGDGATDLQVKPIAKLIIGYGGIAVRDKVKNEADWFITGWKPLLDLLM